MKKSGKGTYKGNCPCQSGRDYRDCCRPYHKGQKIPVTAEALMRARYSAFAKNRPTFLLDTWHPSTRPPELQLDRSLVWTGLEIHSGSQGVEGDIIGFVTFTAYYQTDGFPGSMTEESEFVRESGRWFYLKGISRRT